MRLQVISKNYGSQWINTDSFDPMKASKSSAIFRIFEHIFDNWYESRTVNANCAFSRDIKGMYNGEADQPAIYTRCGAIRQGIETFIEIALEGKKTVFTTRDLNNMDIESAFE